MYNLWQARGYKNKPTSYVWYKSYTIPCVVKTCSHSQYWTLWTNQNLRCNKCFFDVRDLEPRTSFLGSDLNKKRNPYMIFGVHLSVWRSWGTGLTIVPRLRDLAPEGGQQRLLRTSILLRSPTRLSSVTSIGKPPHMITGNLWGRPISSTGLLKAEVMMMMMSVKKFFKNKAFLFI